MRNESCLGRVFAFPKSIIFWCLFVLLINQISTQIENETFETAFGLDTQSMDNKESIYPESNENVGQIPSIETQSEVVDLNEGGNNYGDNDETEKGIEEVPASGIDDDPEKKNKPEDEIAISHGLSGKMAGRKIGKYVRYGKYNIRYQWA